MKVVGTIVALIVSFLAILWVIQGNEFFMYRYFAPRYEIVKRDVFENTPSYKWGMTQELQNMQFKYEQATKDEKDALRPIILRRMYQFGDEKLTSDLLAFKQQLENERRIIK
jgi:hypothetical protein